MKYIDYPFFSYQAGFVKPNKRIYLKFLKKFKAKPEEVIMIGDKKIEDVIAPQSVGMNAIHFKNFKLLKKDFEKFGVNI